MQHWCTESANVIKNALKFGSFALEEALKCFFPSTLYLYYSGTASHLYEFSGSPRRFKGRVQRWWALQEQEKTTARSSTSDVHLELKQDNGSVVIGAG